MAGGWTPAGVAAHSDMSNRRRNRHRGGAGLVQCLAGSQATTVEGSRLINQYLKLIQAGRAAARLPQLLP